MKIIPAVVAVVSAVLVCTLVTHCLMEVYKIDSDEVQDSFVGVWNPLHYTLGEYDDDLQEFTYVTEKKEGQVTIDDSDDCFHVMDIFGNISMGVYEGGVMMTSAVLDNPATVYLSVSGDYMRMAIVNEGRYGVAECILVRDGVDPVEEPDFPVGMGTMPEAGTVYGSIKAEQIVGDEVTSVMDDAYTFEMIANHGSIVFYKVTSENVGNELFLFSSVEVDHGEWVSISPHVSSDDGCLIDTVHIMDGVICTSGIQLSDVPVSWYICYAEGPRDIEFPSGFEGMRFDGIMRYIFVDGDSADFFPFQCDIFIEFQKQFDERLHILAVSDGEGSMEITEWYAVVSEADGYRFCIRTAFIYDGKGYQGLYHGFMDEDGYMVSIGGLAVSKDGSFILVKQTY